VASKFALIISSSLFAFPPFHYLLFPLSGTITNSYRSTTQAGVYGAHEPDSDNRVIEPHTGLPMNVEKYGTGAGGTDASSTVPGAHQLPQGQGTDWEAIKKGDTLY
jgi:hypothetical protein